MDTNCTVVFMQAYYNSLYFYGSSSSSSNWFVIFLFCLITIATFYLYITFIITVLFFGVTITVLFFCVTITVFLRSSFIWCGRFGFNNWFLFYLVVFYRLSCCSWFFNCVGHCCIRVEIILTIDDVVVQYVLLISVTICSLIFFICPH